MFKRLTVNKLSVSRFFRCDRNNSNHLERIELGACHTLNTQNYSAKQRVFAAAHFFLGCSLQTGLPWAPFKKIILFWSKQFLSCTIPISNEHPYFKPILGLAKKLLKFLRQVSLCLFSGRITLRIQYFFRENTGITVFTSLGIFNKFLDKI